MAYIKGWLDHYQFENAVFCNDFIEQLESLHKNRRTDVFAIIDEIKNLEGVSSITAIKAPKPLRGQLKGFWHKHYFQSGFIVRNIINHWELDKSGSTKFDELWHKLVKETGSEIIDDTFINKLMYELIHSGAMEHMQQHKATGEWIVFARH